MKNYIMAWRNLWRNRRRTMITVASILFGVLFATLMSSMQEGSYSNMINNVVKFYSGYIQVHDTNYWENKTLYNSFEVNDTLYKKIRSVPEITNVTPRLESFALVSVGDLTQPAMIVGVDPEKENKVTNLSRWITSGSYLTEHDDGILLAEGLARNLAVGVNDTLALLSQGYYGNTVAAEFVIRGILHFPSPELNKKFAYLELNRAQTFYSAKNLLTSLVLMVPDYSEVKPALRQLRHTLGRAYSVMSWDEMQPEMVQMINGDRAGGIVMKAILYMVIAFGILGTIMMMLAERRKELGIMIAVGMQKYKLGSVLFYETIYMGVIGVLTGLIASIPVIIYMLHNPIPITGDAAKAMTDMGLEPVLMFSVASKVFVNQIITVFAITLVIALYPFFRVGNLKAIKAIRD
ncbi:MAG TPA: ABC transporter permease [Bacteroidales bacterium]|nr:ABC transporter permease [Bacteroidales bacterium]